MLIKAYLFWGLFVIGAFTGLAASGTLLPIGGNSGGSSHSVGPSYFGFYAGGWGFGK